MKFDYFTRMQHSPQGLQKIYFCAHPVDFDAYLNDTAQEILALQNCAVWYDTDPEGEYTEDELYSALKSMNLFVIPITRTLLTTANRAMDVEIEFAFKNHIPILPIIKEEGTYELFNNKFGSIQFLDCNAYDEYAIPYKEKLSKFLSSVIIGDELTSKIRNAFDAYIFLSYRKKDRKQAMELMELIHQNDFMRDIAIWYDEYLTPGENFNEAIRSAFEKSSLFVLNVTPSILERTVGEDGKEKKNYVLQTEYPMAVDSRKKILPAETVATDKEKLSLDYPELPPCVEATNSRLLCSALYNAFDEIALRANDNDPCHNFFIGLAYLNGIDVEVNKPRGVELIRSAAEKGLVQAIKKLISMYDEGDGVERSPRDAIMWRERLIEKYEEMYRSECDERIGSEWFWEVIYLSDALGACGMTSARKEKSEYAIRLANEQLETHNTYNAMRNLYIGYERAGTFAKNENDILTARLHYCKGMEIAEFISQTNPSNEAMHDMAGMYKKYGDISRMDGDILIAKDYYTKALNVAEGIDRDYYTDQTLRIMPMCYEKLGDILKEEGDLSEAKYYYLMGLQISNEIAESSNTLLTKRDISLFYGKLGDLARSEAAFDSAKKYYLDELELASEIFDRVVTVESVHDLINCYVRLSNAELELGNPDTAKEYLNKALMTHEYYPKDDKSESTTSEKRDLWVIYTCLSAVFKAKGNIKQSEKHLTDALDCVEHIYNTAKTIDTRRDLALTLNLMGDIAKEKKDVEAAKQYYKKALSHREEILSVTNSLRSMQDVMIDYEHLGNLCMDRKMDDDAREYYIKGLSLGEEILDIQYSHPVAIGIAIICSNLGDIEIRCGNRTESMDYFQKANNKAKEICQKYDTPKADDVLAVTYFKLSFFYNDSTRYLYLKKAFDLYEKLSKKFPDNTSFSQRLNVVKQELERK